ncbi:Uma2 family endonuclease [Paraburkholderia diazotrophica]|uniref:Putative restriction endonuclease n=1 Tax=Paraburkholderia diazotrophica TaxID=667676 RepID=A0A1H7E9N6_9BURK|nr:Uma2 family endonuclease [Paraburkholderia diazotrophica]SEK07315.1 Putative restriction endonuclease [Paraburkholderia diazotrophica]
MSTLLERDGLVATWRRINADTGSGSRECCELNERGEAVPHPHPSARRQIVLTDVYCQIAEQIGHVAAMSVAVTTPSFGIRVPDVVWMPPDKWEGFDREAPVPFVPDLCVEVLLDRKMPQDISRRVRAYLAGGAREVIVVSQRGELQFWGANGPLQASALGIELSLERMYFEELAPSFTASSWREI